MHADDSALCSLHEPARVHRFAAWGLIEISIFFLGSSMIDVMHACGGRHLQTRPGHPRKTVSFVYHLYISPLLYLYWVHFLPVELLHVLGCISRSKPINVKACCKKKMLMLCLLLKCVVSLLRKRHTSLQDHISSESTCKTSD